MNEVTAPYIEHAELERFVSHYRTLLATGVHRASTLVVRALRAAGVTPLRLHVLAARAARDPSWNCGFENSCLVVVRSAGHPRGRLGLWVENGMLCMEMEVGRDLLTVRDCEADLRLATPLEGPERRAVAIRFPRDASSHAVLRGFRGRLMTTKGGKDIAAASVAFRTSARSYPAHRSSGNAQT